VTATTTTTLKEREQRGLSNLIFISILRRDGQNKRDSKIRSRYVISLVVFICFSFVLLQWRDHVHVLNENCIKITIGVTR